MSKYCPVQCASPVASFSIRVTQASYASMNFWHLGLHASSRSGRWSTESSSSDLCARGGGGRVGAEVSAGAWDGRDARDDQIFTATGPVQIFLGQARARGVSAAAAAGGRSPARRFRVGHDALIEGRSLVGRSLGSVARVPATHARRPAPHPMDVRRDRPLPRDDEDPGDRRRTRARSRRAPPRRAVGWPSSGAHVGVGVRTSSLRRFALLLRVLRSGDGREGNLAYLHPPGMVSQVTRQPRITVSESSFPTRCPRSSVTARSRAHSRARERVTTAVVAHPTSSSH